MIRAQLSADRFVDRVRVLCDLLRANLGARIGVGDPDFLDTARRIAFGRRSSVSIGEMVGHDLASPSYTDFFESVVHGGDRPLGRAAFPDRLSEYSLDFGRRVVDGVREVVE